MPLHPSKLVLKALPVTLLLLSGCAQQTIQYQKPAPVYRSGTTPQAAQKPEPQPAPAPKPQGPLETFKLNTAPIVGEEIAPSSDAAGGGAASVSDSPGAATDNAALANQYQVPGVTVQGSPAVLALMEDAERNGKAGNLEAAAATVERAMRIDPRNAGLHYKLAQIRLQQSQPRLAEELAKKSAVLAEDDRELKRDSWLLIAKARALQGDASGAQQAEMMAESF